MDDRLKIALKYFDENRDFMNGTVKRNIEKYRKGKAIINVTDANGKPIENVHITVKQISHEFKHGANLFMLNEFENKDKNDEFKKLFSGAFDLATLPLYWDTLEPEKGKPRYAKDSPRIYRRPPPDLCVEFCGKHGIEPKAHCLNYDYMRPDWVRALDVDGHKNALEKRFKELAERYAAVIPSWEVVNEPFRWYFLEPRLSEFYYADDFIGWSFVKAKQYYPNNRLIINDNYPIEKFYGVRSAYYAAIEKLLDVRGAKLDEIGMQFHCFFRRDEEAQKALTWYNPEYLYTVFDTYARFGKKIQISEMTIPAYSDAESDEDVQAELIKNLYTLFFSHPAMDAIIYWNTVDGYAFGADKGDMSAGENVYYGGLVGFDFSKKRSYNVIKDHFDNTWRTKTECASDGYGNAYFDGFFGDYRLTAEKDSIIKKVEIKLKSGSKNDFGIVL